MVEPTNIVRAFTEAQAARLTGLTVHRLRYWDESDFFSPSFAADGRAPYRRVYSFQDLLSLQILKMLVLEHNCSVQHLRQVKQKLQEMGEERWNRTTLYVLRKKVVLHDEKKGEFREPVSGQIVMKLPLQVVRHNMEAAIIKFNRRAPSDIGHIKRQRNVGHNAEVIAGTRIAVASIKRLHEDGLSVEQIRAEYPALTEEDVMKAIRYQGGIRAA